MKSTRGSVLIVDDSIIVLEIVREVLEQHGFEVETSNTPLGCTKLVAEMKPDVLVLDIGMPALDGPSLLGIIRRNRVHDCPVLLYSDCSRSELIQTIRAAGADGGAIKTPGCTELVSVLESVMPARAPAPAPGLS